MMRTLSFEDLPAPECIDLECEYSYHFDPGKVDGPPERCYPPEEDSEIILPDGWEQAVVSYYMTKARAAIKFIEGQVKDWETDGTVAEWAEEDSDGF